MDCAPKDLVRKLLEGREAADSQASMESEIRSSFLDIPLGTAAGFNIRTGLCCAQGLSLRAWSSCLCSVDSVVPL